MWSQMVPNSRPLKQLISELYWSHGSLSQLSQATSAVCKGATLTAGQFSVPAAADAGTSPTISQQAQRHPNSLEQQDQQQQQQQLQQAQIRAPSTASTSVTDLSRIAAWYEPAHQRLKPHAWLLLQQQLQQQQHGCLHQFRLPLQLQHCHHQPRHQQQHSRGFISLPSWQDFQDESRAATNGVIGVTALLSTAAAFNRRLLVNMIQSNALVAKGEWWRLLTASFIHSGILHLAGNMLALNFLGPPVEQLVGRTCFLTIYAAGALAGGLAFYHQSGWMGNTLGASGAIAGLFAAWVVYKLRNRSVVGWSQFDTSYVVQMVAINALLALALSGSLAHAAHVGGMLGGGAAMWLLGPRLVWVGGRVENRPLLPIFTNLP